MQHIYTEITDFITNQEKKCSILKSLRDKKITDNERDIIKKLLYYKIIPIDLQSHYHIIYKYSHTISTEFAELFVPIKKALVIENYFSYEGVFCNIYNQTKHKIIGNRIFTGELSKVRKKIYNIGCIKYNKTIKKLNNNIVERYNHISVKFFNRYGFYLESYPNYVYMIIIGEKNYKIFESLKNILTYKF